MSNALTITGKIKTIGATETITDKFSKRQFVLDVQDGNYTNQVAMQFVNDKTDLLDNYKEGQDVRVHFNIRSREWNGKWFSENTCWGIASANAQPQQQYATDVNSAGMVTNPSAGGDATIDPLPF